MNPEIKEMLYKMLKTTILILIIVTLVFVILAGSTYIILIEDGSWRAGENSPSSFGNHSSITPNGIETNTDSIIDEMLTNAGFSSEQIENIRKELVNQGYSGEELENKVRERMLELLDMKDVFDDVSNINTAQLIWEANKELYSKYLDTYEQLEYLMQAELVTKMPHLDNLDSSKLNGVIYFDRCTIDGNTIRLQYITEAEFDKLIENNDENVLNYFTMTENAEIKIAYYYQEDGSIETNDTTVNVSDYDDRFTNDSTSFNNSGYETRIISYDTIVPARYSLPFEYLWALLVMTEDYDFVEGLAKLAYDSEIIISIYDNLTENTVETEYTYTRTTNYYEQTKNKETETTKEPNPNDLERLNNLGYELRGNVTETIYSHEEVPNSQPVLIKSENELSQSSEETNNGEGDNEEVGENEENSGTTSDLHYYVKKKIHTYTILEDIKLTYANVWIVEYSSKYNYFSEGERYGEDDEPSTSITSTQGQESETEIPNSRLTDQTIRVEPRRRINQISEQREFIYNNRSVTRPLIIDIYEQITYKGDTWRTTVSSQVDIKEDTYLYTSKYTEDPDAKILNEKTNIEGELDSSGIKVSDNFCSLLAKSKLYLLLNSKSWLFEILENNQETADMVDLTKYLLSKTEKPDNTNLVFNFDIFEPSSFNTVNFSGDMATEFINAWENGALNDYLNGRCGYTGKYVTNYVTEDKEYFICYTDVNGTRNYGFGVCHYNGSNYMHVDDYRELGIDITLSNYNSVGISKLKVSIVNQVRDKIIYADKQAIINDLQSQGINLTDNQIIALLAVKYQYGNIGNFIEEYKRDPDNIRQNFKVNGYKPFLTGYTGNGSDGSARATANWRAFNEGIYTDGSGNEIVSTGGDFLNVAAATWKIVCNGNYTYGGASSIPVKGTTIDCSSYVSWVLYNHGYTEFGGYQTNTQRLYSTNWNAKYGWQEIFVKSRENPIAILHPGDIFVRYEGTGKGQTHHVLIVTGIENGRLMAFDCGNEKNWRGNTDGKPIDRNYFLTASGNGKIIRITGANT